MKKTLLQINVTANWGSTGKIAEQIGLCAMANGWSSYIAYGRMMNPSQSKLIKIGTQWDVYEHYVENLLLDNEGLASRKATKAFLRQIDKLQPDVVHLHNIHDHYLNYKLLFSYLAEKQIPVVWTQHDQWATTGHCHYNLCGCERWKTECHDCPLSKWYALDHSRRNHRLKQKLLAKLPSLTIVPVSDWLGNNISQSHLKERDIRVIHNGIDIHTFSPQPTNGFERYGIDKQKKIILGVAAVWDARKGLEDFYELAKRLPSDEFAIVIVGQLTEEAKIIDNGCQMVFVNRTQNALELAQLYSSASVFVNPTYQDNYPTTNLEAMACGTPVVTYKTGGSPESVDVHTGMVVEQGDIAGLVKAIHQLSSGDYAEACRGKAEREFDNTQCFNPYISLYNKLIGGGRILILGVASVWSKDKGLDDFIALSRMDDFVVVLVGLRAEQADELRSEKYKNCNLIPVCRTQNQQELVMMYSMADVFVNPTYADMFPTVNLEALACGTPVITYRTGGSPEAVDEKTGVVIEQGDLDGLANAIRKMKENPLSASDCRKRAEMYFDKDKCFEEYIKLYESLLNNQTM